MKIVIGITGASGSIFAKEFVELCPAEKFLIASRWGKSVMAQECGITVESLSKDVKKVFANDDLSSPLASGSNAFDAMVILPCSASTLAKIACGIADSLLTRTASVALKERRQLVLCLRETPLSTITLEQMHRLSSAGVVIMPIAPGFYQGETSIEDLARRFAERVCQVMNLPVTVAGWKSHQLK